ncbi:RNA polymerase [Streptomyces sp. alain-838]|nr:RNA polymerase [Streptomyces sp. alain-838]
MAVAGTARLGLTAARDGTGVGPPPSGTCWSEGGYRNGTGVPVRTLVAVDFLLHERIRSGDREAFAEIFDEHARIVYAHAIRTTGDWAMAEDVMSLTFLEAWRLRDKLREEVRSVRAWLLGIATNVMRNIARSARRHREAMSRLPPPEALPDFSDDVVGQMADAERLAAAARALQRLKRGEREVFTLVVWSDLGYAAAAEALGIPVGTVRSRLSRAREKLRKFVDEELVMPVPDGTEPRSGSGHISHSGVAAARTSHRRRAR